MRTTNSYRILFCFISLVPVFLLLSCSTEKNTFTRRVYHNLTAHYNVYWNGREALLEAELELDKQADDNYTKVLPVFKDHSEADAQSVAPLLDRAIEKGSKTILRHSMEFGGKEYVKWIDDAYMLIGKSYFYKKEFYSARRSFHYVMRNFDNTPEKYTAMLWLARTYMQLEEFEKAEPVLNLIQVDAADEKVPREAIQKLPLVYSNYYILQEKYSPAVDHIYDGLQYNPQKDMKTRLNFILAQIYQQEGDYAEASRLYTRVIKRNPPYEMAFHAKINLAMSFETGQGDSEEITRILQKMLKDEKNKDYTDQIYYALAEVALRRGNDSAGIRYLKKSVLTSVSNDYQKARSSLRLADLYFELPDYEGAQAYYDTAVRFLPKDYPNYDRINTKAEKLSELVVNLQIIQKEDSLQAIARMPEEQRLAFIDGLIEAHKEEERLRKEREQEQAENEFLVGPGNVGQGFGSSVEGNWYFYNASAVGQGYTEFVQQWGRRKLEDLWRLKDKQAVSFEPDELAEIPMDSVAGDSILMLVNDPLKREYYLSDLPLSEEAIEASDKRIMEAYYNLGLLYREALENPVKSIDTYEELMSRYPENAYRLQTSYQLYRIYTQRNNQERADYYKTLIMREYPDSEYAMIIDDPDYYKKARLRTNKLAELYRETYNAYTDGRYFSVIDNVDLACRDFGDTASLIPKFAYLKALSIGKIDVVDSLVVSLRKIVEKYPDSEVEPLAQNMLDHILKENPRFAGDDAQDSDTVITFPYTYDPEATHMYMLIVKKQAVKLNPIKVKISDFNTKYFRLKELKVNSVLLDKNQYLITVGNFEDAKRAVNYYRAIQKSRYVFSDLSPGNYQQLIISSENYPQFYKDKDLELYTLFFNQYYETE